MFDSPGLSLFVVAVIIFVGWYAVGTQFNVRRGSNALKWLQKGLPLLGEKATLRWLGSTVVELKISKAKDPFRSAEVLIAMEPRDVPLFWAWGHLRGRRDLLIVRGQLENAPRFDVEADLPGAWAAPKLAGASPKWTPVQGSVANNLQAEYRGDVSPYSINRLVVSASQDGVTLTRFAIRGAVPNLEVHYLLPRFDQVSAQRVFSSIKALGEQVIKQ
ncbi:MAG: hypothetical protein ACM3JD_12505 [Rudaea sp.]